MEKLPFFELGVIPGTLIVQARRVKEQRISEKAPACLGGGGNCKKRRQLHDEPSMMEDHCLSGTSLWKTRLASCQGRFLDEFLVAELCVIFNPKVFFVVFIAIGGQKCLTLFDTKYFSLKNPHWISLAFWQNLSTNQTCTNRRCIKTPLPWYHLERCPHMAAECRIRAAHIQRRGTKSRYYVSLQSEHRVRWALKWEASVRRRRGSAVRGRQASPQLFAHSARFIISILFPSDTKACPLAWWVRFRVRLKNLGVSKKSQTSWEHIFKQLLEKTAVFLGVEIQIWFLCVWKAPNSVNGNCARMGLFVLLVQFGAF